MDFVHDFRRWHFPSKLSRRDATLYLDLTSWAIDTENLEIELQKASGESSTKSSRPADLYGQSVDLEVLENLVKQYGVRLIVDSAESLGASYKNGRKAGTGVMLQSFHLMATRLSPLGGGMLVHATRRGLMKLAFCARARTGSHANTHFRL